MEDLKLVLGLDFGYTNDPTAFVANLVDIVNKEIYVFDEHYQKGMFNEDIVKMIEYKGFTKSKITADSAEEKSIRWMKRNGLPRIRSSVKGPDSVIFGYSVLTRVQGLHTS